MGNTHQDQHTLQKGQGYRVITIKNHSPFQGKVQQFFDFIIDATPAVQQKTHREILNKLDPNHKQPQKCLFDIINENAEKEIKVKVVSTKFRKVRTIDVIPSKTWSNQNDLTGVIFRKQRYDEVFQTYFPISDLKENSPIKKSGAREGQYIIGCVQFGYPSLQSFVEGLYEIYFDKAIENKNIHVAFYDIAQDILFIKEILLKRGWGGQGLIGCQFLQGRLNKFPSDLQEQRKHILIKQAYRQEKQRLRNQLGECDGASKVFYQALQLQKSKRGKRFRQIRNLLNANPPKIQHIAESQMRRNDQAKQEQSKRIEQLQLRVQTLQNTLAAVRQYLNRQQDEEINYDQSRLQLQQDQKRFYSQERREQDKGQILV